MLVGSLKYLQAVTIATMQPQISARRKVQMAMMRRWPCLRLSGAVIGAVVATAVAQYLTAATISGTVKTAANKPIRAGVILHDLSTPRIKGAQPFDRQYASKPDGTFQILNVPAGKYEICIEAPQEKVLDPCTWSAAAPVVTLATSTSTATVPITVATGYMLQVRVNDDDDVLPKSRGQSTKSDLSMTVLTSRRRHLNLRVSGTDSKGLDHYLVVPHNESLILAADSSTLALHDQDNKRFDNDSARIPLHVKAGEAPVPVTLNVRKK